MSHNLDRIVYINLDKREDRKTHMESQIDGYNLREHVERFSAVSYPDLGIYGCGMSHLGVLKMAKERGYKNVLILEDDFVFLVTPEVFEQELEQFFAANVEYDVCMISYLLIKSTPTVHPFLLKVEEAQTASGYIVNSNYYDTLISLYEDAMPKLLSTNSHWIYANDQVWKSNQKRDNWVCLKTRIGKQLDGYSDNSNTYRNYDC